MGKGTHIVDYWKEKIYCRKEGHQTLNSQLPLVLSLFTLQAKFCLQNSYTESLVPSASECSRICYKSGGVKIWLLGCWNWKGGCFRWKYVKRTKREEVIGRKWEGTEWVGIWGIREKVREIINTTTFYLKPVQFEGGDLACRQHVVLERRQFPWRGRLRVSFY